MRTWDVPGSAASVTFSKSARQLLNMQRYVCLFLFGLLIPLPSAAQTSVEERLKQPFVSLLDLSDPDEYTHREIAALRSDIAREKDIDIDGLRKESKRLQKELEAVRRELKHLNANGSRDTP